MPSPLPRSLVRIALTSSLVLIGVACEGKRELREWQPSDHQPPPAVAPEGQGTGASDEQSAANATARAAATLFEQRCASCHGVAGHGDGPGKPPGAPVPDLTTREYQAAHSDEEMHAVIKNGRGLMPAFASQLTDLGIDAMIQHVRTLAVR